METGSNSSDKKKKSVWYEVFRIALQAFTLTFLAEWGDRSQLTTIILGAREVSNFSLFYIINIFLYVINVLKKI